jgi:tetratricopeptide (TPR) repeat protein
MHTALLSRQGKLPGPAVLLDEEGFRALPDAIGLPAAGAFMTWLRQTYGPAGLKAIYGWDGERLPALATALGTNEIELAASFSAWAGTKAVELKKDIDFLDAEEDARANQLAGDWGGMAAALKKALDAKPGDPQTMFNLAAAQMRADDFAAAEATLKALLASPLPPTASRFVVFGHYQLGRVYDLAGRRTEALAEYDAVLALPDDHGSHDLARERKAAPATKAQLE